jgi:hypothetical protein
VVSRGALPPALAPGKAPGWYPAPDSPNNQLYWDGQAWVARQKWTAAGFQALPLTTADPHAATRKHISRPSDRSPALGLITGLIGVILVILSFTTLTWSDGGFVAKDFAFFHTFSSQPGPELTKLYFGWLAVSGFILTTAIAFAAKLRSPAAAVMRALGAALAVAFAALTFAALAVSNSIHDVLAHAGSGFWTAVVGFICLGAGAIL